MLLHCPALEFVRTKTYCKATRRPKTERHLLGRNLPFLGCTPSRLHPPKNRGNFPVSCSRHIVTVAPMMQQWLTEKRSTLLLDAFIRLKLNLLVFLPLYSSKLWSHMVTSCRGRPAS